MAHTANKHQCEMFKRAQATAFAAHTLKLPLAVALLAWGASGKQGVLTQRQRICLTTHCGSGRG